MKCFVVVFLCLLGLIRGEEENGVYIYTPGQIPCGSKVEFDLNFSSDDFSYRFKGHFYRYGMYERTHAELFFGYFENESEWTEETYDLQYIIRPEVLNKSHIGVFYLYEGECSFYWEDVDDVLSFSTYIRQLMEGNFSYDSQNKTVFLGRDTRHFFFEDYPGYDIYVSDFNTITGLFIDDGIITTEGVFNLQELKGEEQHFPFVADEQHFPGCVEKTVYSNASDRYVDCKKHASISSLPIPSIILSLLFVFWVCSFG